MQSSVSMTGTQAIEFLYSRLKFGSIPGLERIEALCKRLGNPQEKLKFIHVGGTNGKGSTCHMIAGMLENAGFKTGLFTSPYVVDFAERIQINGDMISYRDLGNTVSLVKPIVEQLDKEGITPTEFEVLTASAFLYFYNKKCDYVVLEVGLGGLCDSTNIIKEPVVSVITSVSYDHTQILGDTIQEIAFQKSGIIKNNRPVVIYPQPINEARDVIFNSAKEKNSRVYDVDANSIFSVESNILGSIFKYKDVCLTTGLVGSHQLKNAATAYETGCALIDCGVKLSLENIVYGIANAKIAARTQVVNQKPLVVIDGGHNPDGIDALCNNLMTIFRGKKIFAIVGMMADKDVAAGAEMLGPLCEKIATVTVDNPRSMKAEALKDIFDGFCKSVISFDNLRIAFENMIPLLDNDSMLLICGSLYLATEAQNLKF